MTTPIFYIIKRMNENMFIHNERNEIMLQSKKPRRVHIDVTEGGKKTADIHMPFSMFRLGMKFGRKAGSQETDGCAKAMSQMKEFDCSEFERAFAEGKIQLPHLLMDTFDEQSATHVVITVDR